VIGSAVLGGIVTAATGNAPGLALDVFVIGGTAVAVLAVRPRSVFLIIPVPALCYLAAATAAGLVEISGQAAGATPTTLAVGVAQWMASGFLAMTTATLLAIATAAGRWPSRRRGPRGSGHPPPSARAGHPPPSARAGHPPPSARAGRPRHRVQRDTDDPAAPGPRPVPSPRAGA
jgi:hypothetical protein